MMHFAEGYYLIVICLSLINTNVKRSLKLQMMAKSPYVHFRNVNLHLQQNPVSKKYQLIVNIERTEIYKYSKNRLWSCIFIGMHVKLTHKHHHRMTSYGELSRRVCSNYSSKKSSKLQSKRYVS